MLRRKYEREKVYEGEVPKAVEPVKESTRLEINTEPSKNPDNGITQVPNANSEKTEKNYTKEIVSQAESYIDVTQEYFDKAKPGEGVVTQDDDLVVKKHKDEIVFAEWIHNTFGGDIHIKQEHTGQKNPDYIWEGTLWDLKSPESEHGTGDAIKSGHKQIKSNPGGIMINFPDIDVSVDSIERIIKDKLKWYHNTTFDIMLVNKWKTIKVIRCKK